MKDRIAAIVLACVLLLAAIPAAGASEEDYTLVIRGGQTAEYMVTDGNETLLRVDLFLEGVDDRKLLTALSLDLFFDSAKIAYIRNSQDLGERNLLAVNAEDEPMGKPTMLVNDMRAEQGTLRFVFASDYGCRIETDKPMLSLYFWVSPDVPAGTEIGFRMGDDVEAESVYRYDQGHSNATYEQRAVIADLAPYTASGVTEDPKPINAAVAFADGEVAYRGATPYVVYAYKAHTPRVVVTNADTGDVINPKFYTVSYRDNDKAGTAFVDVTLRYCYSGTADGWFKIYLPAGKRLTVENVQDGILLKWTAVEGAAGYVIYRRAWSTTTNGWTDFARWDNTTELSYLDGHDADHRTYAGTRYQYGVKAYPVDPMDNYNLGIVGPLKTTVRITTRTLNSVTPGSKRLKAAWTASKVFTGYELQVARDEAFTQELKTVLITDYKTCETTVKNLKSKKVYYVRVRSYHEFEGFTYYGEWSNVLSCKVK